MTALAVSSYAAAEHQRICRHEAFHATAGLLLDGVEVRRAAAPFRAWREHTAAGAQIGQTWIRGSDLRATAIGLIAGPLGETGEAPFWPLIAATPDGDQAQISELVGQLGLDEVGYAALVDEARELCASPRFKRLASVVAAELERHGVLDEEALRAIAAEEDDTSGRVRARRRRTGPRGRGVRARVWRRNPSLHGGGARSIRECQSRQNRRERAHQRRPLRVQRRWTLRCVISSRPPAGTWPSRKAGAMRRGTAEIWTNSPTWRHCG